MLVEPLRDLLPLRLAPDAPHRRRPDLVGVAPPPPVFAPSAVPSVEDDVSAAYPDLAAFCEDALRADASVVRTGSCTRIPVGVGLAGDQASTQTTVMPPSASTVHMAPKAGEQGSPAPIASPRQAHVGVATQAAGSASQA